MQAEEEMSPEERAALKKKEIEAEFIRYKLARKVAAQKAAQEGGEVNNRPHFVIGAFHYCTGLFREQSMFPFTGLFVIIISLFTGLSAFTLVD